jgi:hypothetical protein
MERMGRVLLVSADWIGVARRTAMAKISISVVVLWCAVLCWQVADRPTPDALLPELLYAAVEKVAPGHCEQCDDCKFGSSVMWM